MPARLHEIEEEYRQGPLAGRTNTAVTAICGKIEAELAELSPEEASEYLTSYGFKDSGAHATDLGHLCAARPDVVS